jgi:diaminohydroxyphosphoribosylaminopyrimidine deaminase/5-amino-6-(5-phosphoribosylamino)uracil reductase
MRVLKGPFTDADISFMRRALWLAQRARGRTSPNPMVGALAVKEGMIIGEDYHKKAGEPHAEALVIRKLGPAIRDADLYVTLEPCCHKNKRTPPCTKAIIEAGIRRVYVAMIDPNPAVSGCGIGELVSAGIEVYVGLLSDMAQRLNEAYIKHITTGMPLVILKAAMTLDGKISDAFGDSKWITGSEARREVHRLRGTVDAVLTAKGTVLADNPQLTCRIKGYKNPLRVVIDPALEVPVDYQVFNSEAPTALAYVKGLSAEKANKLETLSKRGVMLMDFDTSPIALRELLKRLGERGITSVMIEGGSSLNNRALTEGVVDRVIFFIAPKMLCGNSLPVTTGDGGFRVGSALKLAGLKIRRFGEDLMLSYELSHSNRSQAKDRGQD